MPTTTPRKNPIERRIDHLASLWNAFAQEPDPRLLRWKVDADGARMVDLLCEAQQRGAGDIPDLFMLFREPFGGAEDYAAALRAHVLEYYENSREDLAEEGYAADWVPPALPDQASPLAAFLQVCRSFQSHHRERFTTLVLALSPDEVADDGAWQAFLGDLVQSGLPSEIRVSVIDDRDAPKLEELCEAEPDRVRTQAPDVDLPGAIEEIAVGARGTGPGSEYRLAFVKLGNAAQKKDEDAANRHAQTALRIAQKQNWPDLQAAVHLVLGGMHLAAKRSDQALQAYREAGTVAQKAEEAGHPAAPKLQIQTCFAEAGALLDQEAFEQAAEVYLRVVPLAQAQGEPVFELEGQRMAAYCHQQSGQLEQALEETQAALAVGEAMEPDKRQATTLPFVGQCGLDLLTRLERPDEDRQALRDRMEALLGPDWEAPLGKGGAAV